MSELRIRDDFAGPGGWSEALASLQMEEVGIDNDLAACQTAEKAGHRRIHTTVGHVRDWAWGPLYGYLGSPPCQTFSTAGKGEGREHLASLRRAANRVADGDTPEAAIAAVSDEVLDERSILVLEPLLAVRDWRPTWVGLEQVPTVLPIWEEFAEILRAWGYSVITGHLNAEQYGVPQTRKRAILMAHREREIALPTPTHSQYHRMKPSRLDPGVPRWITMAEALGWGMTQRPYPTIACSRSTGGPDKEKVGGSGARKQVYAEREPGRWLHGPGCDCPDLPWCGPVAANEGTTDADMAWVYERPSPTIVGSYAPDVVARPAYRKPGDGPRQKAKGSVRITLEEAGVLQSFRRDYPWQGSATKQFQQVGNAIPPLLARAILAELTKGGR